MEFKTINKHLENLVNALKEENEANTEMLDNFYTYLETEDKKYLKLANKQLREILKGAGFGILLILPFSPITIPYLFKRAQKLGIDIIPELLRYAEEKCPKNYRFILNNKYIFQLFAYFLPYALAP